MLQKLQAVWGGSAFSFGRLFCSCIHSPVTSFLQFKSLSCLSIENSPLCSFLARCGLQMIVGFHYITICLKLSFQALSWIMKKWSRKEILFSWSCQDCQGDEEQGVDLRKLVSKQDISEGEKAGLEIWERDVGILGWGTKNECVHWSEGLAFHGYIYLANRKGTVRNKYIVGK